MFTINVVHEVRWLPNDVEARLGEMANRLDFLTGQLAQANHKLDLAVGLLEGEVQTKINELTIALKPEADALEQAAQPDNPVNEGDQ